MLKGGNETSIVGRPEALDERIILATECFSKYKFTIPMVIDGKVAFYVGRGPRNFKLPPVKRVLKQLIANDGCHVGEAGRNDSGGKIEACAQCHHRDGIYSRRQILGPGGEFDMVSRHISGKIEDED